MLTGRLINSRFFADLLDKRIDSQVARVVGGKHEDVIHLFLGHGGPAICRYSNNQNVYHGFFLSP